VARVAVNPVGPDGKRKRGRPPATVIAQTEAQALRAIRLKARGEETEEQRVKRIGERFNVMYRLTKGSIQGAVRSLIVSGAPGVGKSYTIEELLEAAALQDRIKFISVRGAVTAVNLYKLLFHYSASNSIILLDDADSIYEDEDAMNLLKAALDTTRTRKLSWLSETAALKAEEIPTSFVYEGAMIFITNKDFQAIIDYGKSKMVAHFEALMSRSIYLDLQLHDFEDLLAWICYMCTKRPILLDKGLTQEQSKMLLEWTRKNFGQFRELSLRTMLKLADFYNSDPTNWESLAKCTLLR